MAVKSDIEIAQAATLKPIQEIADKLGIPGEALTAMMLSVFYVHNVVPGPGLFQNDMDFVVALYLALLALNVIVLVFLLMGVLFESVALPLCVTVSVPLEYSASAPTPPSRSTRRPAATNPFPPPPTSAPARRASAPTTRPWSTSTGTRTSEGRRC